MNKKIFGIIFLFFLCFIPVCAQIAPYIVFENVIYYDKIYRKESEDTFHINIYWDLGEVSLSEHSKCEIDSLVKHFNSSDSSGRIDIFYWDYDCTCNSVSLYRKRGYFLFDYLKDKLHFHSMHVYHSSIDCERWKDEHALPLRVLFFKVNPLSDKEHLNFK